MPTQSTTTEQDRAIRDTATRESHPYTDPRANYPTANAARQARKQGAGRRAG